MSETLFEDEDGNQFWWKDCEVAGCKNQICIGRSDRFCWPHWMMGGDPAITPAATETQQPTPAPEAQPSMHMAHPLSRDQ